MSVRDLSDERGLEEVLAEKETVVLDFWAPWCPPCKEFAPVFEAVAERNPDVGFCRVNTKEDKTLAEAFEVEGIPSLVVIRDRILLAAQPGYLTEAQLASLLDQVRAVDMEEVKRSMEETGQ